jgi:hypothetical protein
MRTGTRRVPLWWLLAALAAYATPPKQAAPPPASAAPKFERPDQGKRTDPLSRLAREYLHTRMARHDQDMQALVTAVVRLDRALIREVTARIVSEPRLARPGVGSGDDDTLNNQLPPRFFTLQDDLRLRARRLSEATELGGDSALAETFGRLTETCVTCHAAFLAPRDTPK